MLYRLEFIFPCFIHFLPPSYCSSSFTYSCSCLFSYSCSSPFSRICSCLASWSPLLLEVGVKEPLAEGDGAPLVLLSSCKIYSKLLPITYFFRFPNVWIPGGKSCIFFVFDTFKTEVQTTGKSPCRQCFNGSQCQR